MKIIYKLLLCLIMISTLIVPVNAEDNDSTEIALKYLNVSSIDPLWKKSSIKSKEKLYDIDMNHIGEVFEINTNSGNGYIITLKIGEKYVVNEASPNITSPYHSNLEKNIYNGPLSYLSANDKATIKNLDDNQIIERSQIEKFDSQAMKIDPEITSRLTINYILDPDYFPRLLQPDDHTCTPTAAAMIVKYYANVGKLTFKSSYSDSTIIDYMATKMGTSRTTPAGSVVSGFNNFMTSYTNKTSTSSSMSITAANYRNSINSSLPVLVTVSSGAISGYNMIHSLAGYGYKQTDDGNTYILAKDPWYKSGSPVREILFNSTNVLYQYKFVIN